MTGDEQVIDIPGVGPVAFPSTMSEDDINRAAAKLYSDATPLGKANATPLKEPTTYEGGRNQSLGNTLKGFFGGIKSSITDLPHDILAMDTARQAYGTPAQQAEEQSQGKADPYALSAAKNTVTSLSDPREGGKMVGNLLTGLAAPRILPAAKAARGPVGRGVSAAGRVAEAAGTAAQPHSLSLGIMENMARGNTFEAAATAAAPTAVKYAGRGMQRLGNAIEGGPRVGAGEPYASTMPGGPQGGTTPPRPAPPAGPAGPQVEQYSPNVSGYDPAAPAARPILRVGQGPQAEPYAPNKSGYKPGEVLDAGAGDVSHGPQVEPYAPSTSGYKAGEVLDEGAGSIPHPPQKAPPPKSSTFDDMLAEEMNAEMTRPTVEPTGDLPPPRTATPGGRPSVTAGEHGELADQAAGSVTRTESGARTPSPLDREVLASIAKEKAETAAAEAAKKGKAKAEPAPPKDEPPATGARDPVRDAAIEEALFAEIDKRGSHNMATSRQKVADLDNRAGPQGVPVEVRERFADKVKTQTLDDAIAYSKSFGRPSAAKNAYDTIAEKHFGAAFAVP